MLGVHGSEKLKTTAPDHSLSISVFSFYSPILEYYCVLKLAVPYTSVFSLTPLIHRPMNAGPADLCGSIGIHSFLGRCPDSITDVFCGFRTEEPVFVLFSSMFNLLWLFKTLSLSTVYLCLFLSRKKSWWCLRTLHPSSTRCQTCLASWWMVLQYWARPCGWPKRRWMPRGINTWPTSSTSRHSSMQTTAISITPTAATSSTWTSTRWSWSLKLAYF